MKSFRSGPIICIVLSCPVLSCPVLSCPVLSCPVLSCPVLSVISFPIKFFLSHISIAVCVYSGPKVFYIETDDNLIYWYFFWSIDLCVLSYLSNFIFLYIFHRVSLSLYWSAAVVNSLPDAMNTNDPPTPPTASHIHTTRTHIFTKYSPNTHISPQTCTQHTH